MKGRIFLLMHLLHLAISLSPVPPSSSLLPEKCGYMLESAIVPGAQTHLGTYPWMAILAYRNPTTKKIFYGCGGSVINERYILTAAHCVRNTPSSFRDLEFIRLGEWDVSTDVDCETGGRGFEFCAKPVQDIPPEEIVIHPDYKTRGRLSDDIALIRLTEPINFKEDEFVQPVCLPERDFNIQTLEGQTATVTGWGFIDKFSNILVQADVSNVDIENCNATYRGNIMEGQVCFGALQSDLCGGDSGGPLVMRSPHGQFAQIGLYSHGPVRCGSNRVPVVYTSVAKYVEWIEQNLRQ